tara:strand:+ start:496 stop:1263 length:768 start_codon:yes stop_codon:yes gene_type:complete
MLTYKTSEDFIKMSKAGKVVSNIHYEIYKNTKPGMKLKELDNIAKKIIEKSNVESSFLGYPQPGTIDFPGYICASPNEVIVHGIPNEYIVQDGDILSIDAGVIYEGYHADAAFTFGIGDVSEKDKELMKITKYALNEAIKLVQDGQKLGTIGHRIDEIAVKNNFGNVRNYVGHGIGIEMHEAPQVPHYGEKDTGFELKTGMAICIEPMFNIGSEETVVDSDGWTVKTADSSKSAHFEHTIGLTEEGTRVFTENLF